MNTSFPWSEGVDGAGCRMGAIKRGARKEALFKGVQTPENEPRTDIGGGGADYKPLMRSEACNHPWERSTTGDTGIVPCSADNNPLGAIWGGS